MSSGPSQTAIIFDLDGTLVDTLQDIANAVNHTMQHFGLPTHSIEQVSPMVGYGLRVLIEMAVPEDKQDLVPQIEEYYLPYLVEHGADLAPPYAGIPELLDSLEAEGITFGILSNKPHDSVLNVVERRLNQWTFAHARGVKADGQRKPDPALAIMVAEAMGFAPEQCIFVGDTKTDLQTGKAAGMRAIGVTWGFRDRDQLSKYDPDYIIDHPSEMLEILKQVAV